MISAGTLAPRCSRRSSWRRNDCVFEETNGISLKKSMMKMKWWWYWKCWWAMKENLRRNKRFFLCCCYGGVSNSDGCYGGASVCQEKGEVERGGKEWEKQRVFYFGIFFTRVKEVWRGSTWLDTSLDTSARLTVLTRRCSYNMKVMFSTKEAMQLQHKDTEPMVMNLKKK